MECHGASRQLGTGLKFPYRLQKKADGFFFIKYRFIIFLSMTFIEFVMLHLNLLLCRHGFRDVNVTLTSGFVGGGSHVSMDVLST